MKTCYIKKHVCRLSVMKYNINFCICTKYIEFYLKGANDIMIIFVRDDINGIEKRKKRKIRHTFT